MKKILFGILLSVFIFIQPVYAQSGLQQLSLSGDSLYLNENQELHVGLPHLSKAEYENIDVISITVQPSNHNFELNTEEKALDGVPGFQSLVIKKDNFENKWLNVNDDYLLTEKTGDSYGYPLKTIYIDLLNKEDLDTDSYLEIHLNNVTPVSKSVHIYVELYNGDAFSDLKTEGYYNFVPTHEGYVDAPVFARSQVSQNDQMSPAPTVITSPDNSEATKQQLSEFNNRVKVLEAQVQQDRNELKRQKNILESILDFIKNFFKFGRT